VPLGSRFQERAPRALCLAGIAALLFCACGLAARQPDEPAGDAIGSIEGDAISITGPMSVEASRSQVRTILRNGADVKVKSGSARVALTEGGQIMICGPAHFSVLKSGGALTIAIDKGTVHFYAEQEPAITVYTAQIKAQSIPIGGEPRDALVGFDATGAMCVRTQRGAMRLEQQLTGESVVVPQGADVLVNNGQLESLRTSAGRCACELQLAKTAQPSPGELPRSANVTGTSAPPAPATDQSSRAAATPTTPSPNTDDDAREKDEPVYQVFMPPLRYDAKAKVQPEVDPALIVLVRRVHVRPTLIFRGRVEGESIAAVSPSVASPSLPAPAVSPRTAPPQQKQAPPSSSFADRVRNFMRKIWPSGL